MGEARSVVLKAGVREGAVGKRAGPGGGAVGVFEEGGEVDVDDGGVVQGLEEELGDPGIEISDCVAGLGGDVGG